MMKTQNKKRGFTIIELVIVVTVIAILSAVLIPVFAGVIKNANLSADKAAVRSLNTMIAESEEDFDDVEEVKTYLEGKGYDLDSYVPASKDYTFVWSADKDMIMIYSEEAKAIVFPDAYAGKNVAYVTLVTDKGEQSVVATGAESFTNGGIVAVTTDIEVATYVDVTNDLVVDLTGVVSNPAYTESRGVFTAQEGGSITLNGNGTVDAKHANSDFSIAVWARGGDVVINGGTYTNIGTKAFEDDGTTANNCELIYATAGGKITINGGTFIGANTKYVLNCKDNAGCSIVVKGGKFWNYNPETMANDAAIIVAEGYKVVEGEPDADGNVWYEVVKA